MFSFLECPQGPANFFLDMTPENRSMRTVAALVSAIGFVAAAAIALSGGSGAATAAIVLASLSATLLTGALCGSTFLIGAVAILVFGLIAAGIVSGAIPLSTLLVVHI